MTSEQAKAESSLRGLEEERRTMMQHFSMEREELEKAKVRPKSLIKHDLNDRLQIDCIYHSPSFIYTLSLCLSERSAGGAAVRHAALR